MFIALCRKLSPTRNLKILLDTHLGIIPHAKPPYFIIRSYSSILPNKKFESENEKEHSFTVSYLVDSCGLCLENAIKASQKVHFETPDRPDSILRLLQNHGFTHAHITKLVRIRPSLLLSNPEMLLPKLNFYRSICPSDAVLAKIVSSTPSLLGCSLENHIIPFHECIKGVLNDDEEKVADAFNNRPRTFLHNFEMKLAPNISVLRAHGVPATSIALLLTRNGNLLGLKREIFKKVVNEVMEMGFNSSALVFVRALSIIAVMTEATWNCKREVFRRWGWSEMEFQGAFRVCPLFMNNSKEKMSSVMEFLVDKMGLQSSDIARSPSILSLSLQKRIIPRCAVIKILLSKGLVKISCLMGSLKANEKVFLDKFVTKYEGDVPQLLSIYKESTKIPVACQS